MKRLVLVSKKSLGRRVVETHKWNVVARYYWIGAVERDRGKSFIRSISRRESSRNICRSRHLDPCTMFIYYIVYIGLWDFQNPTLLKRNTFCNNGIWYRQIGIRVFFFLWFYLYNIKICTTYYTGIRVTWISVRKTLKLPTSCCSSINIFISNLLYGFLCLQRIKVYLQKTSGTHFANSK